MKVVLVRVYVISFGVLVLGGDGRRLHPRCGVDDDSSLAQRRRHSRAQSGKCPFEVFVPFGLWFV